MGRKDKDRKRKNSSNGDSRGGTKNIKNGGSSDLSDSVSDVIRDANSVLFANTEQTVESEFNSTINSDNMDSSVFEPSNSDIMALLKTMNVKMSGIDRRLEKLDSLERQVGGIEGELKKLWNYVHDISKKNEESVSKITDKAENLEFALGVANENITQLQSDKIEMEESMLYLQSQSMRNNLIFSNIPEESGEQPAKTEEKVRNFIVDKMNVAQDIVNSIRFERVHRMGGNSGRFDRPRNVVAKFTLFRDRELVRRARTALRGTQFYVNEQFPKAVADRRKSLRPQLRAALSANKQAWISYDTLYVDGRPVRAEPASTGDSSGRASQRIRDQR